ncbi:hypothetical protein K474DRAFT_722708 [Panus rudis PR-1116 ss-1]|nr:hypothetical protein K474DRAFT_722708 [Panus rudis PR-1116 ss-1]
MIIPCWRFTLRDRRPLDPPPVVQLRLTEIFNLGQIDRYEQEFTGYDEVAVGMCCHVDLLRMPNKDSSGMTDTSKLLCALDQGHIDPAPLPDSDFSQHLGPAISSSKIIPDSASSIQAPFPAPSHHPTSSLDND